MSFIASCPFCRRQVQAPDSAAGQSITCKRCHNSFTLAPSDDLAPTAISAAPPTQAPVSMAPAAPTQVKTQSAQAQTDTREHSVAATTPETQPLSIPAAPAPIAPAVPEPASPAGHTAWNPFAVTALLLAGVALFCAGVDWLQWLTVPLAGGGLLTAVVCLLATPLEAMRDAVALLTAGIITLGTLVVALCLPSVLGLDERITREPPVVVDPNRQVLQPRTDSAASPTTTSIQPLEPGQWADAERFDVDHGNVRLRIAGVAIQDVPPALRKDKRKDKELVVTVVLSHVGLREAVSLQGWSASSPPRLSDTAGQVAYRPRPTASGATPRTLVPFQPARTTLVFAVPSPGTDSLRLELPATAFGGTGSVRFAIPRSMIK